MHLSSNYMYIGTGSNHVSACPLGNLAAEMYHQICSQPSTKLAIGKWHVIAADSRVYPFCLWGHLEWTWVVHVTLYNRWCACLCVLMKWHDVCGHATQICRFIYVLVEFSAGFVGAIATKHSCKIRRIHTFSGEDGISVISRKTLSFCKVGF